MQTHKIAAAVFRQSPASSGTVAGNASYRHKLYSARRVVLPPNGSTDHAMSKWTRAVRDTNVFREYKQRRYYMRPGEQKRMEMYESNKRRFNGILQGKISKILEINAQFN